MKNKSDNEFKSFLFTCKKCGKTSIAKSTCELFDNVCYDCDKSIANAFMINPKFSPSQFNINPEPGTDNVR